MSYYMSNDDSQFLGEFKPCNDDFLGDVLTKGDIIKGNAQGLKLD